MKDDDNTDGARPLLITSVSTWTRFSDYELVNSEDGIQYIIPAKNAVVEQYNPFDCAHEIIEEFLNIAQSIPIKFRYNNNYLNYKKWDKSTQLSVCGAIMRFAKRYGLLGLFWQYGDIIWIENGGSFYEDVKLKSGSIFYREWVKGIDCFHDTIEYSEYVKYFFPRNKRDFVNYHDFDQNGRMITGYTNEKFLRLYGEPVLLFLYELQKFYTMAKLWDELKRSGGSPNDVYDENKLSKMTWGDILNQFRAGPYNTNLYYKDSWHISWSYKCLNDALKLLFMFDVTSAFQKNRICRNVKCGRAYVAKKDTCKYCGPSCANAQRVRTKRGREKELKNQK